MHLSEIYFVVQCSDAVESVPWLTYIMKCDADNHLSRAQTVSATYMAT